MIIETKFDTKDNVWISIKDKALLGVVEDIFISVIQGMEDYPTITYAIKCDKGRFEVNYKDVFASREELLRRQIKELGRCLDEKR